MHCYTVLAKNVLYLFLEWHLISAIFAVKYRYGADFKSLVVRAQASNLNFGTGDYDGMKENEGNKHFTKESTDDGFLRL